MGTAKIFQSGNSQAVRLPKEFRFSGTEVEIFRRGNEVVLMEKGGNRYLEALELLSQLPPEIEDRNDTPPQQRDLEW